MPEGRVTLDGRYLVITLDEGTLSNGVSVLALEGSAKVEPVFAAFDGLQSYLGSRQGVGTELLFATTAGAARGRVGLHHVELELVADHRLVPEGAPRLDRTLERAARCERQRTAVELDPKTHGRAPSTKGTL